MSERAHEWAVLVVAGFVLAFVACTGDRCAPDRRNQIGVRLTDRTVGDTHTDQ